jgi:hypothetical protein
MSKRSLAYLLALSCGLSAVAANAADLEKARKPFADADHVAYFPVRGAVVPKAGQVLVNHGGPVITSAKVVFIFWGPSFSNAASPDFAYATALQAFRNQFGTTPEFKTITQYSGILLSNLAAGTADLFDTSTPPTNVTDAIVRSKVQSYLTTHTFDNSTIYEVVLPASSYSSSGSSTSCGGPSLAYCAYHGHFANGSNDVKYSIEPYPSCSGCKVAGWTDAQNQEHFVCHETREAVTDPTGTAAATRPTTSAPGRPRRSSAPVASATSTSGRTRPSPASRPCDQRKPLPRGTPARRGSFFRPPSQPVFTTRTGPARKKHYACKRLVNRSRFWNPEYLGLVRPRERFLWMKLTRHPSPRRFRCRYSPLESLITAFLWLRHRRGGAVFTVSPS